MDRLRDLIGELLEPASRALVVTATSALLFASLASCEEEKVDKSAGRFAAVKSEAKSSTAAASSFCEKTFPAVEPGTRKFIDPPERPIDAGPQPRAGARWRWINLWATWCRPCVEEMAVLGRWEEALAKDGAPVKLELWSVDDDEASLRQWVTTKTMPGRVHWLKDAQALTTALETLGVDKASAIPIHALVDGNGQLRCVRVGNVHDSDYGAIKAILEHG